MTWVRDSFFYFISRAVPAAVGLVLVGILIRILGKTEYGTYGLAFSGANLVSVFGAGWLAQAILRFHPVRGHGSLACQSSLRRTADICGAACVLLLVVMFLLAGNGLRDLEVIVACSVLVFGLSIHAIHSASLQAALRARQVAALEVGRALVSLPLAAWFAQGFEPAAVGALAAVGLSYVMSGFVARALAWRSARELAGAANTDAAPPRLKDMLQFGWMVSVWLALSLALPFVERLVITHQLGVADAGTYAAVYDVIFRGSGFLMLPIVLALHPRIMRAAASGDLAAALKLWRFGMTGQVSIAVGLVIGIALAAPLLLRVAGLEASPLNAQLAIPLAIGGCVWQIALLAHKLLEVTLNVASMVLILAVCMVACVAADLYLAARYGLVAVAYVLVASGTAYCLLVAIVGRMQVSRLRMSGGDPG